MTRGNFIWKDGVIDSEVIFEPNENGRFIVCDKEDILHFTENEND